MRIVSLLPAATEIVTHLGLRNQLVGVSHACQPAFGHHQQLPSLTRSRVPVNANAATIDACVRDLLRRGEPLFELDETRLIGLRPDVILSQSLCNVCAIDGNHLGRVARILGDTTRLVEWSPTTLNDVIQGIEQIGVAVNASDVARTAAGKMRRELFAICQATCLTTHRPRVAFLEWIDPLFCAGHWIPEMVELAGGMEVLGVAGSKSRQIRSDELHAADPEIIVVCCCGWSANRTIDALKAIETQDWWRSVRAVNDGNVHVVDAESAFTMPGPSLVKACSLLAKIVCGGTIGRLRTVGRSHLVDSLP